MKQKQFRKNCVQNRCERQFQTLMILEAVGDGNGPERERKETDTLHDTMCVFVFLFFLFQILYFIIFCLFSMHLTQTSELPSSGNFFELEVQLKPQLL